jgi:hypothetical protein
MAQDKELRCVNEACRSENVVLVGHHGTPRATEGKAVPEPSYRCRECGTTWAADDMRWWAGPGG